MILARHFLASAAAHGGRTISGFSPEVESAFATYGWPGNVRELENLVERAVILAAGNVLSRECFPDSLFQPNPQGTIVLDDLSKMTYRQAMEAAAEATTRTYLEHLLALHRGNVTHAASHAGMERESLHRLLRRHGLRAAAFKAGTNL